MKIIKCKNYEEVSSVAAKIVADQVALYPKSVLGLPTGSTPVGMYLELIKMYKNGTVDFGQVTTFNLDEYYPISKQNEQSFYYFMHKNFFSHVNIPPENIHMLSGETDDPQRECANYERIIQNCGGIDLQILGIGQNGHIGFNEPGDSLESLTHIATLTQSTIEANARFFVSYGNVPKMSLTMGVGTILKARKIVLLASGKEKQKAALDILKGKITPQNPSTILSAHNDVTLIADTAVL